MLNQHHQEECTKITEELLKIPLFQIFKVIEPWTIQGYLNVIKQPMDLDTVQKRLKNGEYRTKKDYKKDMKRIFDNCKKFNGEESLFSLIASQCQKIFEEMYDKISKNQEEAWIRNVIEISQKMNTCSLKLSKLLGKEVN